MLARIAAASLTLALAAGAVGTRAADPDERLRRWAAAAVQDRLIVRIGLEAAHAVAVASDRGVRILDVATGKPVWRETHAGTVQVVAEGGPVDGAPSVFRVQVGAYSARDAAQGELERFERTFDTKGVLHHDPDRGTWRVRLGEATERLALGPLVERLRAGGIDGPWIAEEPAEPVGDVRLRLVDASFESVVTPAQRLAVLARGDGRVRVDGKPYRGVVELRIGGFGTVQPVNWIDEEQYLLGVVPAELGPEVWPQLAALRAQAVAARTYVRANLGQFSDEGFDLCATPRCQVYAGAAAEHPLSNRAVWSTKGEILTWQDEPIAALYTATCGGHTENGGDIFPEHDAPYLRGVPCRAENAGLETQRGTLVGPAPTPIEDETGADVTRDWTLLAAAGVLDPARAPGGTLDASTLRNWTESLATIAGRPPPAGKAGASGTLGQAAASLLADLGWEARAEVLLSGPDASALLRDPELAPLAEAERRALAYLAWVEALRPYADGKFHADRAPTPARLAPALVRIGGSYEAFGLRSATVSGVGKDSLRLVQGRGELRLPVARDVRLFGLAGGRAVARESLELWPGDSVRFRVAGGAIDFLELIGPVKGASDDRTARVYSWEVRRTRHEIESVVNRNVAIGTLRRLEIVRRGVSGRVVELRLVGSKGETVVRGFDVRRLLDLRESLLVIEPQHAPDGSLAAVVFAGKGWGHGVGLCQVGAYGMAVRGANYREILAHYYSGAVIDRPSRTASR